MGWTARIARWITSQGIFVRLSLIFGSVIVVSTVMLGMVLRSTGEDAVKDSVWRNQKEIAARTAGEIEQLVKGPIENLQLTAEVVMRAMGSVWRAEAVLVQLTLRLPIFRRVVLMDTAGREVASSDMVESGADRSGNPGFQAALSGHLYRSDIRIGERAGWKIPVIALATPVEHLGEVVAVLWAEVDLTGMWDLVDGIRIGRTGWVFVVSDKAVVIAHPEKSRVFGAEWVGGMEIVRKALSGEVGTAEFLQEDRMYMAAYAPMRDIGWAVIVQQPAQEAYEPVRRMRRVMGYTMGGSLGLTLALSILIAMRFSRPLRRLMRGTREIAEGHLDERIHLRRHDEIGLLAESFNQMAEELQRMISARERAYAELERANEELKTLDRLKTEFVSNVSHELRTPLTAMTANVEYLLDLYGGQLEQDVTEGLEAIGQGTGRLQTLVNDLLDFSRMESGRLKMIFAPVALGSVIEQAEQEVQSAAEGKGIRLIHEWAPEVSPVRGDRDRLVQVFVNLLDNAVKFTPSGGTISVRLGAGEDNLVRAEVADTGIGIPPDEQEKVFDRFYQVDGSSTRTYGGTGLGLSIVKAIIVGHGGEIWVESTPGQGATFVFTLPVWKGEA